MVHRSLLLAADHEVLSSARQALLASLAGELDGAVVGDVGVVLAELAANAVDHTASTWIRVEVEVEGSVVLVIVSHDAPASSVPAVGGWACRPAAGRGLGLGIVRALCADVVVAGNGERTTLRCRLAITDRRAAASTPTTR